MKEHADPYSCGQSYSSLSRDRRRHLQSTQQAYGCDVINYFCESSDEFTESHSSDHEADDHDPFL
jgi:hypothetical protein